MFGLFTSKSLEEFKNQLDQTVKGFHDRLGDTSEHVNELLQKVVRESQLYEYLDSSTAIWDRALAVLERAQEGDEIKGTASEPNDPAFEKMILVTIDGGRLIYRRFFCYPQPAGVQASPVATLESAFPPSPTGEIGPDQYMDWYEKFYERWLDGPQQDHFGDAFTCAAMRCWQRAIEKLHIRTGFRFSHYPSFLVFDFLIRHSGEGHSEAILAFPRVSGLPLGGGFYTRHQRLANDFNLTLERLRP